MSSLTDITFEFLPTLLSVEQDPTPLVLDPSTADLIERHWTTLKESGKILTRGITYTVASLTQNAHSLRVSVRSTDYAHYLATVHGIIDQQRCRVIFAAGAIVTSDSYLVLGKMASWTTWAGRWQLCGGGLNSDDTDGQRLDLEMSLRREMHEELGIKESHITSVRPLFLKRGGPFDFYTVIYSVKLRLTRSDFLTHYAAYIETFTDAGEPPEFSEVALVYVDSPHIKKWLTVTSQDTKVDYLPGVLERLVTPSAAGK